MTTTQIETLFFEVIQEKAIYNKTDCFTENQIYNWRKKRTKPTIGDMLGLLYQLKKIEVRIMTIQDVEAQKAWDAWIKKTPYPEIETIAVDISTLIFQGPFDDESISSLEKSNGINTLEGLNKLPEIVENMFGRKNTLSPVTRTNSNEPNPK